MAVASSGTAVVTLPADTEIVITRDFDAPKALVYKAYTTSDLVKRWWAGQRGEMILVEIDLRVGGSWRYVMTTNDGQEVGFHGEFREIVPEERLVMTEIYEGMPEGTPEEAALNTVTFTEADGRTTMTIRTEVSSKDVRDMIIDSGMEGGMQEHMDLLEQVAISLG